MSRLSEDAERVMTDAVQRFFNRHSTRRKSKRIGELLNQLQALLTAEGNELLGELEAATNTRSAFSQEAAFLAGVRFGHERLLVRLARAVRVR
jgi:hypothetical protein